MQTYRHLLSIVHAYAYIDAIGAYTDAYAEGKLKSGDVLFAVDGTPVYRAPLNLVASKLLGLFFFLEA
jgi:hypothetical protein